MMTPGTLFAGFFALMGLWMIAIIAGYVFWLWMFIHSCIKRDILWVVLLGVSFFTGVLPGILALVYYLAVYRKNR